MTISDYDINVMDRDFFTGFIKIHILFHAAAGEICGTEIAEELARHGYEVSPGWKTRVRGGA